MSRLQWIWWFSCRHWGFGLYLIPMSPPMQVGDFIAEQSDEQLWVQGIALVSVHCHCMMTLYRIRWQSQVAWDHCQQATCHPGCGALLFCSTLPPWQSWRLGIFGKVTLERSRRRSRLSHSCCRHCRCVELRPSWQLRWRHASELPSHPCPDSVRRLLDLCFQQGLGGSGGLCGCSKIF
jgi:hypothetical protein